MPLSRENAVFKQRILKKKSVKDLWEGIESTEAGHLLTWMRDRGLSLKGKADELEDRAFRVFLFHKMPEEKAPVSPDDFVSGVVPKPQSTQRDNGSERSLCTIFENSLMRAVASAEEPPNTAANMSKSRSRVQDIAAGAGENLQAAQMKPEYSFFRNALSMIVPGFISRPLFGRNMTEVPKVQRSIYVDERKRGATFDANSDLKSSTPKQKRVIKANLSRIFEDSLAKSLKEQKSENKVKSVSVGVNTSVIVEASAAEEKIENSRRSHDASLVEFSDSDEYESDKEISMSKSKTKSGTGKVKSRARKVKRYINGQPADAVSAFHAWNLRFSNEDDVSADAFLSKLIRCIDYYGFPDDEILPALATTCMGTGVSLWFDANEKRWSSFRNFEKDFRSQFCPKLDRLDLYDELRKRTQAVDEPIGTFITMFSYIANKMKPSLSAKKQLALMKNNLHPRMRRFIMDKDVKDLETLRYWGEKFERQCEKDARYKPPPSKDEVLIPEAAYSSNATASGQNKGEPADSEVAEQQVTQISAADADAKSHPSTLNVDAPIFRSRVYQASESGGPVKSSP